MSSKPQSLTPIAIRTLQLKLQTLDITKTKYATTPKVSDKGPTIPSSCSFDLLYASAKLERKKKRLGENSGNAKPADQSKSPEVSTVKRKSLENASNGRFRVEFEDDDEVRWWIQRKD